MSNDFCPTCPVECAVDLPPIDCSTCYTVLKGQVAKIYIGIVGNPLADATGTDMPGRLDNVTTGDETLIRVLCVKGQLNAPDVTTEELECDIDIVVNRAYTITVESNNVNDDNYEFSRTLQNCQGKYLLWYTMLDETHLYGGEPGVEVSINPNTQSSGDARTDRLQTVYDITWNAGCDPPRIANPVAGLVC